MILNKVLIFNRYGGRKWIQMRNKERGKGCPDLDEETNDEKK